MQINKKRATAAAAALVVTVGAGGAAFAYWSGSGSGTGTASTASSLVALTVNQTSTLTAMYPGLAAQTLSGNFNNPNSGPVYVGTVTASIASVTDAAGAAITGCTASDYTLANAAMTVGVEVASGAAKGAWTGATIAFNNSTTVNQDACKGAVVNLAYTIS